MPQEVPRGRICAPCRRVAWRPSTPMPTYTHDLQHFAALTAIDGHARASATLNLAVLVFMPARDSSGMVQVSCLLRFESALR